MVLPRKALEASGMKDWRQAMLTQATFTDVTTLTNKGGWVFDDVEPRYTIGLVALRADRAPEAGRRLPLRGPFPNLTAYRAGIAAETTGLLVDTLLGWSETAAFPQLPSPEALTVFLAIRDQPRLDCDALGWSVRGLRELNATDDKDHFLFEPGPGLWPVYKGESFERWNPETGVNYAWAKPRDIVDVLQRKRSNQIRMSRSAFYAMPAAWAADPDTLPVSAPRIAWRDIARANDSRTVIAALVPPRTVLIHLAYYLFWREGGPREQAYALGVISAMPFDWFTRQVVEQHITVEYMRSAPVPRFRNDDPLCQRVVTIAGTLAAIDDRYAPWAEQAGVPVGGVPEGPRRDDVIAELDAVTAHLYHLGREQLEYVFRHFHDGWNYEPRMTAALAHFDAWTSRIGSMP